LYRKNAELLRAQKACLFGNHTRVLVVLLAIFTTLITLLVPIVLSRLTRTISVAFAVLMCALISAGIIVQSTHFMGLEWTANLVRILFCTLLIAGSFLAITQRRPRVHSVWWLQVISVGLPSLLILIRVLVTRVAEPYQLNGLLTSIQYINPEDNAKWSNVASLISQGKRLGITDIGGVLTTFLVLFASFVEALFPIIGMNNNEVNVTISTVVFGQLFLIIFAPLALLPLTKLMKSERNFWTFLPGFWVASLLISGGSAAFLSMGHLSSQLVLVMGIYAVCVIVSRGKSQQKHDLILNWGLLCATATASIWLPLQLLTALIPLTACVLFIFHGRKRIDNKEKDFLVFIPLALMVAAIPVAIESFRYLVVTDDNFQNLLIATGATQTVTPILSILPLVLFGVVLHGFGKSEVYVDGVRTDSFLPESYGVFASIAFFTFCVTCLDFLRTGSAHYGSIKVQYMCALVLIVVFVPMVIVKMASYYMPIQGFIVSSTLSLLLLFALSGDATLTNLTQRLRSEQWPQIAMWSQETNWQAYVTQLSLTDKTIRDFPIGCAEIVVNERYWHTTTATYLCTRHLVALSGLEKDGEALVVWQLRSDWKNSLNNLRELPESVKSRNLLILSSDGKVVDIKRVDSYFENQGFQR
jgi:hypothetical protein